MLNKSYIDKKFLLQLLIVGLIYKFICLKGWIYSFLFEDTPIKKMSFISGSKWLFLYIKYISFGIKQDILLSFELYFSELSVFVYIIKFEEDKYSLSVIIQYDCL